MKTHPLNLSLRSKLLLLLAIMSAAPTLALTDPATSPGTPPVHDKSPAENAHEAKTEIQELFNEYEKYSHEFENAHRGINLLGLHYDKAASSLTKGQLAFQELVDYAVDLVQTNSTPPTAVDSQYTSSETATAKAQEAVTEIQSLF